MSADSEKPNIIGGNWTKYCTVAKSVGRGRPIWTSVVVGARASLALCGRFNQFRSPYSWITMRRALRKRRVFDFVPSYLKGEVRRKMNFTCMLGFVVLRGVVKFFPVSSSSFARKTTGRNRARSHSGAWRGLKTKWDLKLSLLSLTYLNRYLFI